MKVTFPHMGNMYIPIKGLLEYLGVEVIIPPFSNKKTMTIGTRLAPEFACLPMKINLGNFVEAWELGADTILMAGGVGPCRFGYYSQVQKEILNDLGYHFQMVVIEPPQNHIGELIREIKKITGKASIWQVIRALRFAWHKAKAVDEIEENLQRIRPREIKFGGADEIAKEIMGEINLAKTKEEVYAALKVGTDRLQKVPQNLQKAVLKVGMVGEIYTLLDHFSNSSLERNLGRLGVEVHRSIYLSEWINEHMFLGLSRKMKNSKQARNAARPYINYFVGGHGQDTVGHSVLYARNGFDGVIQVAPFTCMPEIVAESVLPVVSKDLDLPIFTIFFDEQSGDAGIMTRLEAFVDLLERRKELKVSKEEQVV